VNDKVKSGPYLLATEAVREACRRLEERDRARETRLEELRTEIRKGLDSGDPVDGDVVLERLRTKSRGRGRHGG
jgi:antitoxin ParD1/3/4